LQRTRRGHFHPGFRDFLRGFSHRTANLILHLLSVGKARSTDGWIQATPAFIRAGLNIDPETQERILARLEDWGVVEVAMRGRQPTRHVRIDTAALEKLVSKENSR